MPVPSLAPSFLRRCAFALAIACALASPPASFAQSPSARPRIERAADLPRFTYPIEGKVEDLVRSPGRFAPFAAAVRRDTESVLSGYEIADKATRRNLIALLGTLDWLDGRYDDVLKKVEQLRALEDKPADRLIAGLRLEVLARAAQSVAPGSPGWPAAVDEALRRALAPLPYAVVENDLKGAKASAELMGETLILTGVREVMQPIVDRSGSLSSDFAPGIVSTRFALVGVLPLKSVFAAGYGSTIAAHQVAKVDIWAARDVALQPAQAKATVAVGVWDSGVDTALYRTQVATDHGMPVLIGYDRYARPSNTPLQVLTPEQQANLPRMLQRVKGFSDLRSAIDSPEATEVKAFLSSLPPDRARPAIEEIRLAGNYVHGTHVAGIALAGNPAARLVVGRIEFGYTVNPDPCPSRELSQRVAAAGQATVDFFRRHGARVVNMSWGGSQRDVESDLEQCGIGRSADERKALAHEYFEIEKAALTRAFASAPEILFVTSAGNSNDDASFTESIPSSIVLPNLLTVGAVDLAGDEAPFTSYGPTVKVHANGYQVPSLLPGGSRVALSGTSMSAPQVTNLAAKLLAVNPKLTPADLVRIIVDTSDATADGRRHLVNPKKALAAAG